jgi:hypothetical protein
MAAAIAAAGPTPAAADELVFACSILSRIDFSDVQPYSFAIRIDAASHKVLDVDGDGGAGWITDRFTDAVIEAHFDLWDRIGGFTIDRTTDRIEFITAFRVPVPEVGQWTGTCVPKS